MLDWVLHLDIVWMVVVVFAATALITAGIWALVIRLASGGRAATLKGLSPGMLPPMGLVFGLLVGFTAAHVWGGTDRARWPSTRRRARCVPRRSSWTAFRGRRRLEWTG